MIFLAGCLKDKTTYRYTIADPIYQTLTAVRANMKSAAPRSVEQTGKIYVFDKYLFVNDLNQGIHVFDNSDPKNPKNISFIAIPGNVDMAVKGNTLYADCYSDLVAFDITDPKNVSAKKFLNNVFPQQNRFYYQSQNPDSIRVVVGYTFRDTTVDYATYRRNNWGCINCMYASADAQARPGGTGTAGSMARFAQINDYLFTVSNTDLSVFNTSNSLSPQFVKTTKLMGWGIETIFPLKEKLFIGANNGMFIFDVSNPATPVQMAAISHFRSCDPVVADDNYAYVTLRNGTTCQGTVNQLQVYSLTNLYAPTLTRAYDLTNPKGLSKDGNTLIVCDAASGVRFYDASMVTSIKQVATVFAPGSYDVIAMNNLAIVSAADGIYQYDYSNVAHPTLLSKISVINH